MSASRGLSTEPQTNNISETCSEGKLSVGGRVYITLCFFLH